MEVFLCYICFEGQIARIGAFDTIIKAVECLDDYWVEMKEMGIEKDPTESCDLSNLGLEDYGWTIDVVKIE